MTFTVTIQTNNDAFEYHNGTEIARILRELADQIDGDDLGEGAQRLFDINGNHVGEATHA